MSRNATHGQGFTPGYSLSLLPEAELPTEMAWATPSPSISAALARFDATIERAGREVFSTEERDYLTEAIAVWDGSDPPLGTAWVDDPLEDLAVSSRAAARLGSYAAFAPHRVNDDVVREFRRRHPGDRELVAAVAWTALQTARHIASWLVASGSRNETWAG